MGPMWYAIVSTNCHTCIFEFLTMIITTIFCACWQLMLLVHNFVMDGPVTQAPYKLVFPQKRQIKQNKKFLKVSKCDEIHGFAWFIVVQKNKHKESMFEDKSMT